MKEKENKNALQRLLDEPNWHSRNVDTQTKRLCHNNLPPEKPDEEQQDAAPPIQVSIY